MLRELLSDIDELQGSLEYSRNFIKTLRTYRERLIKAIVAAEKALASLKDDTKYNAQVLSNIVQSVKDESKFILQQEILEAVKKNKEFAFPRFVDALLSVADEPNLITIRVTGTGKSARISVDIELLGYAGNLSDWARGVVQTRDDFNISRGPDAEKASRIWREKVYQRGPYDKTIEARIKNSEKPAAFWLLLDKGTTSLASDRGGTAYPSYSVPTNFVEKTIKKIKDLFKTRVRESLSTSENESSLGIEEINRAKSYVSLIDSIVEDISTEIEKNRPLYSKFSKVATYVDQNKLDNVLVRLRKNLDVNVTSEGRIELGVSGRRYRPYISRLQSIIGE